MTVGYFWEKALQTYPWDWRWSCWIQSVSSQVTFHEFYCISGQVEFKKKKRGEDGVTKYTDGTLQSHTNPALLTLDPLGAVQVIAQGSTAPMCPRVREDLL